MSVYAKELRLGILSWCLWTIAVLLMMSICLVLFPLIEGQEDKLADSMSDLEVLAAVLGMDKLNIGELMGFYGIECRIILGLGGGFSAALAGASILEAEERDHTAGFLFTHPVGRVSVLTQKLFALITQIVAMNAVVVGGDMLAAHFIKVEFQMHQFLLLHGAYLAMQLEIAGICFGISAFIRKGSTGIGMGLALLFYSMDIAYSITEKAAPLRHVTPYAYCIAGDILMESELDVELMGIGMAAALVCVVIGYVKYVRKDLAV